MAEKKQIKDDVAIIGMSVKVAGADNYQKFWENLKEGRESITEIPKDRWDYKKFGFIDDEKKREVSRWGGFIDDVACFDHPFFSVSKHEADNMDPQQRILMEQSWKCFEDAGICPEDYAGHQVGVFIACLNTHFKDLLERNQEVIDPHHLTGTGFFALANRLSYFYDFRGPSICIDTACSGGLVAVKYGVDSILSGESEIALVGAPNILIAPDNHAIYSSLHVLSPTGKIYCFDKEAHGYVRGEGCVVVLLKSLKKAIADGDNIHGVIRGVALSHCGHTPTLTYPSDEEQASAISKAIKASGVSLDKINYIELHGTGTRKGDPIEFSGLTKAFDKVSGEQKISKKNLKCGLGSVKANIGHLESAAGLASLAKVLLAMEHGEIPKTLNFTSLNPLIQLEGSPFHLVTEPEKWGTKNKIAGISSWGIGGTNSHLILESYENKKVSDEQEDIWHLLVLSAATESALKRSAVELCSFIKDSNDSLQDISYTLMFGRQPLRERMAFVCKTKEEAIEFLSGLENTLSECRISENELPEFSLKPRNTRKSKAYQKFLTTLGEAFVGGIDIRDRLRDLFTGNKIHLPAYSFDKVVCKLPEIGPVNGVLPIEEKESTNTSDDNVYYYAESWVPEDIPGRNKDLSGNLVVIVPEGEGKDAASKYTEKNVLILEAASSYKVINDKLIHIRCEESDDYVKAVKSFFTEGQTELGIIDYLAKSDKYKKDLYLPSVLIKAVAELSLKKTDILSVAEFESSEEKMLLDSCLGFERSLSVVLKGLTMRFMIVEKGLFDDSDLIDVATKEYLSAEKDSVLYEGGIRKKCRVSEISLTDDKANTLTKDGVYLMTGGLGGIGQKFAAFLLKEFNANLVLTGRSTKKSRLKDIEELKKFGGNVDYLQADAASKANIGKVISFIKKTYGRLDGVLALAGIESEESILKRNREDFERTLSVKIDGAKVLDKVLEEQEISPDFILYFSSSSAFLGDFGSCDYAVANRFLKSFTEETEDKVRKLAICWPLWKDGGISLNNKDAERLYLSASGQEYMTSDLGAVVLKKALSSKNPHVLVMKGKKESIDRMLGIAAKKVIVNEPEDDMPLKQKVLRDLFAIAESVLGMSMSGSNADTNFADIGFDSIMLEHFAKGISDKYGIETGTDIFFGYPTFGVLAGYLSDNFASDIGSSYSKGASDDVEVDKSSESAYSRGNEEDSDGIAIIGMSGQFPDAENVDELWEILINGSEVVAKVPESRFVIEDDNNCRMGMIHEPELFDPLFFGISPSDANEMDPRHRLLLEESYKALEDAGLGSKDTDGANIGVFIGAEDGDWRVEQSDSAKITSAHEGIMASRLAYMLNFSGPCMSINTACSSGLTAFHQAVLAIKNGDCDTALVGGVNLTLTKRNYMSMKNAGMLSKDGRCRTFDNNASGMIPSDAVAVLVLKRLSLAKRDRHRIYGLVKATGINYDGKSSGITAPNLVAQENLYRRVYENGPVDPRELSLIVTHGTGTRLGDPIEVNALKNAFGKWNLKKESCSLISIKPNIGHSLAASGIVNLIALLLSMKNEIIPVCINFENINSQISLKDSPFVINLENRPWKDEDGYKLAATNSFGMSGTNVHVVVGSYSQKHESRKCNSYLMLFSAKTENALKQKLSDMRAYLKMQGDADMTSISYTLMEGRSHYAWRCALVVRDVNDFINAIDKSVVEPFREVAPDFYEKESEQKHIAELLKKASVNCDEAMLKELAESYLKGYSLDGNILLSEYNPERISLPKYPFENVPCWNRQRCADSILLPRWEAVSEKISLSDRDMLIICKDSESTEKLQRIFDKARITKEPDETNNASKTIVYVSKEGIVDAFKTTKKLLDIYGTDKKLTLVVLTFGGQEGPYLKVSDPEGAGVAGFFGVLAKEVPNWSISVLNFGAARDLTDDIRNIPDIKSGETASYGQNSWFVRKMVPAKLYDDGFTGLRENGVYVVIGGAGDVGSLWSEYAVRSVNAKVIWSGRRAINDEIEKKLDYIKTFGKRPVYVQGDALDRKSLEELKKDVEENYGKINGVIFSAVADFDRGIQSMDAEEFEKIVALKTVGCVNTNEVFGNDSLDFMLFFSSSSAIDMPLGQAGYVSGCCFQDAYAHMISASCNYMCRTVNWGFWGNVGAGKTMPKSIRSRIQLSGMGALDPESAFYSLSKFLKSDQVQAEYVNMICLSNAESLNVKAAEIRTEKVISISEKVDAKQAPASAEDYVLDVLVAVLKLQRQQIDKRQRFENYGIDSITIMQLIDEFRKTIPEFESTAFYECQTISELINYIDKNYSKELGSIGSNVAVSVKSDEPVLEAIDQNDSDIAVIGMSGRFANADNISEYWRNLANGVDSIVEIPSSRWDIQDFYEKDMEKAIKEYKSYCKVGGFLKDINSFDSRFFHISPKEAASIDPQERLLLEESYKALEDAAWSPERLKNENRNDVGVFVGVTRTGFELYNQKIWDRGEKRMLITNFSQMANRISYCLDLTGPSLAIDTMCSSSLTTLNVACTHIRSGAVKMAVVGAVNIYTHPATYRHFCQLRMLSPTGRCHTFSKDADGFVPGESVCAIVLKPLSAAIKDNDRIIGIIKGGSINHDGRTNGFTVPNPNAQADMIRTALTNSHINAREISYVEAHGTGTKLGDPIEIKGLTKAYRMDTKDEQFCAIGSAKSNIGHCEASAGLAGVIKVLLQMQHKMLVPSLHADELNPLIQFSNSPFKVQRTLEDWKRPVIDINGKMTEIKRIAAVSAFGAGGSNAHIILEESPF